MKECLFGALKVHEGCDRGIVAEFEGGWMEADVWAARIMRVAFGRLGAQPSCRLDCINAPVADPAAVQVGEGAREVRHRGGYGMRTVLERAEVEVVNPDGEVVTAARAVAAAPGRFRLEFPLHLDTHLFGFGLQLHSLLQRGRKRFLKVNADPKDDSGNGHVLVPLVLSTRGWGVLVNTHEYTWWDMGAEASERWYVEVPGDAIEIFVLLGSLREQVREYLRLTGAPAMPPKWGLGFWYRPKSGWDEQAVKDVLEEFRRRDIPVQVVGLEPSWQTHSYPCSFVWNRQHWPDPAGFVRWLEGRGMKLNLWEHAYVHESSPMFEALEEAGAVADVRVFGGLVPDFTMPQARRIFVEHHERETLSVGVAGFKLDECDGGDYVDGWGFPDDAQFPGGLSGAQMHNVFGYLYQKTMHELYEGRGRRTYFLCRANYAGGQAYATCNYSDWYGFAEYVRLLANAGFACTPWCPEVRRGDDAADFVRRSQVMFFSWLAMINAWSSGMKPWDAGPEAEEIFRRYARLREKLLPYIYAEWAAQAASGRALTRALAVDFQADHNALGVDDQYMFGRWMMVAPVVEGEGRDVYLPPGEWMDWWTGERLAGPQTIGYQAPLDRLPIFVRRGAIIPMLGDGEQPFGKWPRLRLWCWAAEEPTEYELYDDDGETTAYRDGEFWRWPVRMQVRGGQVFVALGRPYGELRPWLEQVTIEVRGLEREPVQVLVNGRSATRLDEATEPGQWAWDGRAATAVVRAQAETIVAVLQ